MSMQIRSEHGTNSRYRVGCRCMQCRSAHSSVNAELRDRHKADPKKMPRWTQSQTDLLLARVSQQVRAKLISKELGKSQAAIRHKCSQLGVSLQYEPQHGTISRYHGKYQCRCAECTKAASDYERNRRRNIMANLTHGTNAAYTTARCRCKECREAHRIYNGDQRKKKAARTSSEPIDRVTRMMELADRLYAKRAA